MWKKPYEAMDPMCQQVVQASGGSIMILDVFS